MTRVLVCGPPGCGKTSFSRRLAATMGLDELAVQHGDDLVGVLEWSEASTAMVEYLEAPGPWIVEGVSAIRACRKFMVAHPDVKPCDVLYLLTAPFKEWNAGHRTMAKGHATIWSGIEAEVRRRGVEVRLSFDDMRRL